MAAPTTTPRTPRRRSTATKVAVMVLGVFLVIVVAIGSYALGRQHPAESAPAAAATTPSASPSQPTPVPTQLVTKYSDCGTQPPGIRPTQVTLTCADDGAYIDKIRWQTWNADTAFGVGTYESNNCNPDCANGLFEAHPASVLLYGKADHGHGWMFSRLTVTILDESEAFKTWNSQPGSDNSTSLNWLLQTYPSE